jgi:hypothetical protein
MCTPATLLWFSHFKYFLLKLVGHLKGRECSPRRRRVGPQALQLSVSHRYCLIRRARNSLLSLQSVPYPPLLCTLQNLHSQNQPITTPLQGETSLLERITLAASIPPSHCSLQALLLGSLFANIAGSFLSQYAASPARRRPPTPSRWLSTSMRKQQLAAKRRERYEVAPPCSQPQPLRSEQQQGFQKSDGTMSQWSATMQADRRIRVV